MKKLQVIQTEIQNLDSDEFIYLKNWINELDAQQWEKEIEADSNAGKLDFLINEALLEKKNNQLKDL